MEIIGNIVYWNLEEFSLSMTTLELAKINMVSIGNKAELHMTNIDFSTLQWIRDSVYIHAVLKTEIERMNTNIENLIISLERNNKDKNQ